MKKISLFLILFALWAIPVRAQEPDPELQEMLADIKTVLDDFEAIIPYHDSVNHFSIMQVYSNDETRFLRVTFGGGSVDQGCRLVSALYDPQSALGLTPVD